MPPPPPAKGGCGGLGMIIVIVVAIVATVLTAGAAAVAMGAAASGAGAATAAGVAAAAGGGLGGMMAAGAAALSGTFGLSAAALGAAAIGGAVGSIASQGAAMAMGMQDKFSWKQVGLGAVGAAVTAGIGAATSQAGIASKAFGVQNQYAAAAINAAAGNAITQGVAVATGLQDKFNWRSVAASAIAAPAAQYIGGQLSGPLAKSLDLGAFGSKVTDGMVRGVVGQGVRMLVTRQGKMDYASIAADAFGNAIGESLASQSEPTVPAPVSAQERAEILEMFERDSPANNQGQGLRLGSGPNGLRLSDSAVAGWNSDVDRGIRGKAQALLNFDEAVSKVSAQEDAEAAVRRQAWLKQQHAQAEAYGRQLDLAAAVKIQGLTRYSAADRLADSNYRLALESQERIARSQSFSPTGQAASRLIDPDIQQAQAMGMDVDYDARAEWLPDPRSLEGTSLAAKAWRSDHELKLGGALYFGVGGNAELTMNENPSKMSFTTTEFEGGLGIGFGYKAKVGWQPLDESNSTLTMPFEPWKKWGDGQAAGTGAVGLKAGIEVSAPASNFVLGEARIGLQSPLNGAPTNTKSGGFYEVKLGEFKLAPTFQWGLTAKIDLFNTSYKRTQQ
jgi:hypothetical protein